MTRRSRLAVLLAPALLGAACLGGLAMAQDVAPGASALAEAEAEAAAAARRSAQLERDAAQATNEAAKARIRAQALVADIERIEAQITGAELRIAAIEALRRHQQQRLAERQQPVIRLTSALQTMARRPPALALVQPGSLQDIVRVRAILASTLPAVREQTAGIRAEIAQGDRLRRDAGLALAHLAASRDALREKRVALAKLEGIELQRSSALAYAALEETDRSVALGERARDLAAEMRTDAYKRRLAIKLAALSPPPARPSSESEVAPRRAPPYRLPVEGRLVTGLGEVSDAGVHARGLTFATAANAPVVAPRAGTVVYAGRFRSYGEIIILDHGHGWATTLTGLAALRVRRGDRVVAGDPIGRTARQVTVELRRNDLPQSITALIS